MKNGENSISSWMFWTLPLIMDVLFGEELMRNLMKIASIIKLRLHVHLAFLVAHIPKS